MAWLPPEWLPPIPSRHAAIRDGTPWNEVRRKTNEGNKVAKYHEDMTNEEIRALEMSFREPEDIIVEHNSVRYFCARHTRRVGASLGEDTEFVKINRHDSGPVHGHPIQPDALKRYIRKKNPELLKRLEDKGFFQ